VEQLGVPAKQFFSERIIVPLKTRKHRIKGPLIGRIGQLVLQLLQQVHLSPRENRQQIGERAVP